MQILAHGGGKNTKEEHEEPKKDYIHGRMLWRVWTVHSLNHFLLGWNRNYTPAKKFAFIDNVFP